MSKEIILTKGYVAIVDDEDYPILSRYTWYARKRFDTWYALTSVRIGERSISLLMHRVIMGHKAQKAIDHINRNSLDNRKCNLRFCNHSENAANRKKRRGSSSKYLGVSWNNKRKKWHSQIKHNQKVKYLGVYENEIDAAKAYNVAAANMHGEFANLNIITEFVEGQGLDG